MALGKNYVISHIKEAEAKLAEAEKSYQDKTTKLKYHPVWRKYRAEVKQMKRRLVAIEKQEARDEALRNKKTAS